MARPGRRDRPGWSCARSPVCRRRPTRRPIASFKPRTSPGGFRRAEQSPKRGRTQLRLLTRPIDRYEDPAAGLLDGMLFSFVVTNNPIVLLVLEAWSEGAGVRTWRYAFASQGDGEQTALLDGKPDWSASSVRPPADTNLHVTRDILADPAVQD